MGQASIAWWSLAPRHLNGTWDEAGAPRTFVRMPSLLHPALRTLLPADPEGQPLPPPHLVFFVEVTAFDNELSSASHSTCSEAKISYGPTAERQDSNFSKR